jgi:hypothetical protein
MSKAFSPIDRYFLAIRDDLGRWHPALSKWSPEELETLWRTKFGIAGSLYLPEEVLQDFRGFGSLPKVVQFPPDEDDGFWLAVTLRLFYAKKLTRTDLQEPIQDRVQIRFTINEGD